MQKTGPTSKKLSCFFCEKLISHRIRSHITTSHADEVTVNEAIAKREKDKEKAFELLKNKGNLKYNIKILRDGAGQLICVRRQKPGISNDLFLPCVYCFGFYRAYELWRHVKYHCQFAAGESGDSEKQQSCSIQAKARMFLESCVSENFSENGTKLDKEFKTKVLSGMLKDTVYHSVVTDNLILAFG